MKRMPRCAIAIQAQIDALDVKHGRWTRLEVAKIKREIELALLALERPQRQARSARTGPDCQAEDRARDRGAAGQALAT
jgi:hypothetical protein